MDSMADSRVPDTGMGVQLRGICLHDDKDPRNLMLRVEIWPLPMTKQELGALLMTIQQAVNGHLNAMQITEGQAVQIPVVPPGSKVN